jgi:hypothetical protein
MNNNNDSMQIYKKRRGQMMRCIGGHVGEGVIQYVVETVGRVKRHPAGHMNWSSIYQKNSPVN